MQRREILALLGAGVILCPVGLYAQQGALPLIGFLHFGSPGPFAYQVAAFRQGLSQTGYVEGQNVAIETRWAEGRYDRLPALAADLVDRKVDLIVALGPPSASAAKNATSTIPIVFSVGTDPVADGLVASLARPGGNLTGFSILAGYLAAKRLELLFELVPQARMFALLVNPNDAYTKPMVGDVQEAARVKGVQLHILNAATESEIDAAFAALANLHADALVVGDSVFFTARREQLVALAARYAVPVIERWREFTVSGGLISYGPSLTDTNRQLGIYAGRILKGTKPADLPVQQPTTFELVVNLKTAKALGLTVPPSILARADEVIE
jgi:putative ABC transport system substrate-binding protein